MSRGRTGLMIIRTWVEEGSSEPLRAEIRISTDMAEGFDRTVTACRAEAVQDTVREWLAEVVQAIEEGDPALAMDG